LSLSAELGLPCLCWFRLRITGPAPSLYMEVKKLHFVPVAKEVKEKDKVSDSHAASMDKSTNYALGKSKIGAQQLFTLVDFARCLFQSSSGRSLNFFCRP
jgi:hypothetical protein